MRNELYHFFVNKQPGIARRYHKMHDGSTGIRKIIVVEFRFLRFVLQISGKSSGRGNL